MADEKSTETKPTADPTVFHSPVVCMFKGEKTEFKKGAVVPDKGIDPKDYESLRGVMGPLSALPGEPDIKKL